ncbi:MAG: GxxExxY protein [Planctomycetes bacterium]|nr:GxxExxY protein [Planctomycetota bacterium]
MREFAPIPEQDEALAKKVIGAAIEVHRELGPGFLESVYRKAMAYELSSQKIQVEEEKAIVVPYKDIQIAGQRLDLRVGGRIIVELKCVEEFAPIHQAQLISYLKATGLRLGLLINFKIQKVKDGIKRVVL